MITLIQVTSQSFDPLGYLQIEPLPFDDQNVMRRRVTKVAGLNRTVVVNDRGFVHGDRDLVYRYVPSEQQDDVIARRLIELHSRVHVSTEEGLFLCVPLQFDPNPESREIRFSVLEKVE